MRANVLMREANGRAGRADHGANICRDIGATDREPLIFVADLREKSCAGGAMASKLCVVVMHLCHRTALGMACAAMTDGLSFDTIFLRGE